MAIQAGQLRHRVTIKQPDSGKDTETGEPLNTYSDLVTVWAKLTFGASRERWANDHTLNSYDVVITLRYRTDIKENMQVHFGGDVFEIKTVLDPYMKKEELKLLCTRYGR